MHDAYERARHHLQYIDPTDREQWVDMSFALKSEFGEAGFDLWDEWGSEKDRPASEIKATWKSAKEGGKIGFGTLIYRARKRPGFKEQENVIAPSREIIEQRKKAADERRALNQIKEAAEKAAAADKAAAIWAAATPSDTHPYLTRKGVQSHRLRVADYTYEWIDRNTGEVLSATSKNCLLIPIQDAQRKVHSIQAIDPQPDGKKRYMAVGEKSGNFYPIGKPKQDAEGRTVYVLGEGYASCASVHECTGYLSLVCFDASNIKTVAEKLYAALLKKEGHKFVILFAADNDLETPGNPGVTVARAAAKAVSGLVAVPVLSAMPEKAVDFNDLHQADGADAVRAFIEGALLPSAPAAAPIAATPEAPAAEPEAPAAAPDAGTPPGGAGSDLDELVAARHFTVLGYNVDYYYIFHHKKLQVLQRTRSDFSEIGLVELAPLNWWEESFPAGGKQGGFNRITAAEWIFDKANARGIYDPNRVRGRGAWMDKGRIVFHHGPHLSVDGAPTAITAIKSGHVYPMASSLPEMADQPSTDAEGEHILDVAKMVRWAMPGSAALLAGWVFLAPVCGALRWRPHVWITGAAGSGKSTIQSDFSHALVREIGPYFQGNSTEPGIRQKLGSDALPVLIDEFEPNDEAERKRISNVLTMIRQSSTESSAITAKGTISGNGMHFHIRSMFCVASINTMLDKDSDSSRLTPLVIRPPGTGGEDKWEALKEAMHAIHQDGGWPSRLMARSVGMLPVILQTIEVFATAAAKKFGSQRHGDQFGTLLAGAWCLSHQVVATPEQAHEMMDSFNWTDHHDQASPDDPLKALGAIMESRLKVNANEVTVFELVADVSGKKASQVTLNAGQAADALNRHGIRIIDKEVIFANTSVALRDLLKNTAYYSDPKGQLLRLPGANKFENKSLRFNGSISKCVAVPLALLFDDDEPPF
jgi:putative DNA primase/helicase